MARDKLSLHPSGMFDGGTKQEDVAARLKLLRIACGFDSQVAFARRTGISQSEINHFESGRRALPLSAANKIKLHCQVTLDWIYHGDRSTLTMEMNRRLPTIEAFRRSA